jgi:hypothetical protein
MHVDLSVEALKALADRASGQNPYGGAVHDEMLTVINALVDHMEQEQRKQDALVMVEQLQHQVSTLKESLAEAHRQLAMERVANPSTSKTVAINAIENIIQNNTRVIADAVLNAVRPEVQAYIERLMSERAPR